MPIPKILATELHSFSSIPIDVATKSKDQILE
jgi:hypothetical protein